MSHVLAAIDFSDRTGAVVATAGKLTRALSARLTLLHVAAPDAEFVGYEVGPQTVRDSRARELSSEHASIHQLAVEMQACGIDCHGLLVSGNTVDVILSEADRFSCDLIVLGSHGHTALHEVFAGSVASAVLRHARCPLVVVPLFFSAVDGILDSPPETHEGS